MADGAIPGSSFSPCEPPDVEAFPLDNSVGGAGFFHNRQVPRADRLGEGSRDPGRGRTARGGHALPAAMQRWAVLLVLAAGGRAGELCAPPGATPMRVGIVGGGIGGLALARALQLAGGFNVTVFERDASFGVRPQGYAVTIQQASHALARLGLLEGVQAEDTECVAHYVFDRTGAVLTCFGRALSAWRAPAPSPATTLGHNRAAGTPAAARKNWHIARGRLREILYESLVPGTVQWGHRLVSIRPRARAQAVEMRFEQGHFNDRHEASREFDLAVGADGICMLTHLFCSLRCTFCCNRARASRAQDLSHRVRGATAVHADVRAVE